MNLNDTEVTRPMSNTFSTIERNDGLGPVPTRQPEGALPSDPFHVQALKGTLAADTCAACGLPCRTHFDSSGCFLLGCEFAQKAAAEPALLQPSWPLGALYGDSTPAVTAALQHALVADCGPDMTVLVSTFGHDELLMVARTLSRIAVSAHLEELAQ